MIAQAASLFDVVNEPVPGYGTYKGPKLPKEVTQLPHVDFVPRQLEPRWYQAVSKARIEHGFFERGFRGQLLVLPTGTGKTAVASQFSKERLAENEPVLLITHRDKLLFQMYDDLAAEGIFPIVEKGEYEALNHFGSYSKCVLASAATLHKKRLPLWPRDAFKWIVIDEAHNALAPQFRQIFEHFCTARLLGLSATPPPFTKAVGELFAYPYIRPITLRQAIEGWNAQTGKYEAPFLSRILLRSIETSMDLRDVGLVGKDFDARLLDRRVWEHTGFIAKTILEETLKPDGSRRPTFVFSPHISSAEGIAAAMRDMGGKAACISYRSDNVRQLYRDFETGKLDYLVNVAILTEGVNIPKVECVALACPTLQLNPVIQKIGRGTRKSPDTGKENLLVLEFNCIVDEGKTLQSSIDAILDGAEAPPKTESKKDKAHRKAVRARTAEIVKTKQELDIIKANELAKEQLDNEAKASRQARIDARRAKYQATAMKTKITEYNPFSGLTKAQVKSDSTATQAPATAEQRSRIFELSSGRNILPPGVTEAAAAAHIRRLEFRKLYRMASEPQLCMIAAINKRLPYEQRIDMKKAANFRRWDATEWINANKPEGFGGPSGGAL